MYLKFETPIFQIDYFTESELACRCCGKNHSKDETLNRLIKVRGRYGKPMVINSSYRCPAHNARLNATITHITGQAVDIREGLTVNPNRPGGRTYLYRGKAEGAV
ncbi:D-Ala-D-Ala carboxypeptidase family metallohydrolase [Microbulbifer sp. CnH-101-G]|uniref:D-Ala-D-Ala carboxypeptidase family metallohydrolase n=1 Tax=Microbulbifer sp. CnH-101-G TaxID=3243393 RepID=UPI004039C5A8